MKELLFLIIYLLIVIFSNKKELIAIIGVIIFLLLRFININNIFNYLDVNIIMMLLGFMITISLFIESKMPNYLASKIIKKANTSKKLIIFFALFSGVISSFIDNVATVLIIAPIALHIFKKTNINPCIPLIIISIFSNLEGAATLIGDTTSILLGKYNRMNFFDFFIFNNKIGLFFIIQISLLLSLFFVYLFIKEDKKIYYNYNIKITDFFPTILLISNIGLLIIVSFIPNKIYYINGLICIAISLIGIIRYKKIDIKNLDLKCIIFLSCLFILIGSIRDGYILDYVSNIFLKKNYNLFTIYTLIVLISVILSAFIDNIPYVATMLPVISKISTNLGIEPTILYFALITGATLGGNLTPIGASSNVASISLLKKEGYNISFKEYFKVSIPITIISVLNGYLLIWFIY